MLTTPSMFGVSSIIENAAMSIFSSGRLIVIGKPDRSPSLHDASHSSVTDESARLCAFVSHASVSVQGVATWRALLLSRTRPNRRIARIWFIRPPGKSRKTSAAVHVSASANVRGTGAKAKCDRNTFPHPRPQPHWASRVYSSPAATQA